MNRPIILPLFAILVLAATLAVVSGTPTRASADHDGAYDQNTLIVLTLREGYILAEFSFE